VDTMFKIQQFVINEKAKQSLSHTCGNSLTFTPSSKTVHQHTPIVRQLSFWIARCLILCCNVA